LTCDNLIPATDGSWQLRISWTDAVLYESVHENEITLLWGCDSMAIATC